LGKTFLGKSILDIFFVQFSKPKILYAKLNRETIIEFYGVDAKKYFFIL